MNQNKPNLTNSPAALTVKGVCAELSIGRTTFRALVKSGRLRVVRLAGRGIRVARAEIDRFLLENAE